MKDLVTKCATCGSQMAPTRMEMTKESAQLDLECSLCRRTRSVFTSDYELIRVIGEVYGESE